jgi:transcriptional regulator with XRE-family HTH domain
MSNIEDDLDAVTDAYLTYLEGGGPAPSLEELPVQLRDEARARLQLVDAMWGAEIDGDPLADDSVARRFGFDRTGEHVHIDGRRVAARRRAAHLELKELLARVITAGGDIAPMALLQLEQSSSTPVSPSTASALVAALDTSLADIEAARSIDFDGIRAFLDSPEFDELIATWAAEHDQDPTRVGSVVAERMLVSQFRAAAVTVDQLLDIARAILRSLDP